jgi:prepilin-type N-terminal cleavage/methylation domain-containing protein
MLVTRLTRLRKPGIVRDEKGFTLVEVVISIMLLGLITAALATGLSTASTVLLKNDTRQTARNLAESQMESVKNRLYLPGVNTYTPATIPTEQFAAYGATITVVDGTDNTVFPFDINPILNQSRDINLQKITVSIFRKSDPTKIIYTLEGYKVQ